MRTQNTTPEGNCVKASPRIIRFRTPNSETVPIPFAIFEDAGLSYNARGLIACIIGQVGKMDLPIDESEIDVDLLLRNSKDGITRLKTAMNELRNRGYLKSCGQIDFVYLIHSKWSGFYKIGRTSGYSVSDRITSMQTGDPSLRIIFKCRAGADYERELQRIYSPKCVEREWFKLSEEDVERIKEDMKRMDYFSRF